MKCFLCELQVDSEKTFYVGDKEIHRVDIIGTVVYLNHRENVTVFEIDDGTGIIQCVKFPSKDSSSHHQVKNDGKKRISCDKDPLSDLHEMLLKPELPLKLGDLVNVRGHLNVFRERPQIIVNILRHVVDGNEEWFRVLEIDAKLKHTSTAEGNTASPKKHTSTVEGNTASPKKRTSTAEGNTVSPKRMCLEKNSVFHQS